MAKFQKFNFKTAEELQNKIDELQVEIRISNRTDLLNKKVKIGELESHNSIAILPMEGCDSDIYGYPSELTFRRYSRFAEGGAGLIWFEACAVNKEGKANPNQLAINKDTLKEIRKLVEHTKIRALNTFGKKPITILQLTHSGRWSRPIDKPIPIIAQHDPFLDKVVGIDDNYPIISDEQLDRLMDDYILAATLAREAGFDGVDVKLAHRYLLSELLAAYLRDGKYGRSFENRTRFGLETIKRIRSIVGNEFLIGCRLNIYDAHPYPYGWGVDKEDFWRVDLNEPMKLVKKLCEVGIDFINPTLGNVYYLYPYLTRPYDTPTIGSPLPLEHPLESIARIFYLTKSVKEVANKIPVIGSGYSWLRQFMFNVGAANIEDHHVDIIGMGRMAFAYPDAPKDLFESGSINPKKVCITCSKCTQLMRDHGKTGCVIRDKDIYKPLYKFHRQQAQAK